MNPRTVVTVMHWTADGREFCETYQRDGELEVQEQMTSWARECALAFWKNLDEQRKEKA